MTGVQAHSQVTNPLMQIPPDAADAGTACGMEWAAHPLPTGADMPGTLAKRGFFGRQLSPKHATPEASSITGSCCHLCREQPKPRRAKMHNNQPTGVCNPGFNKTTTLPCWDQRRTQETKEDPSLAKGWEILTGAFNSSLGNPPSPPHQNPTPAHPARCPQYETSHHHSVLSMKYLPIDPSTNALLSIATQNFLILPVARMPSSAQDKYLSSFT